MLDKKQFFKWRYSHNFRLLRLLSACSWLEFQQWLCFHMLFWQWRNLGKVRKLQYYFADDYVNHCHCLGYSEPSYTDRNNRHWWVMNCLLSSFFFSLFFNSLRRGKVGPLPSSSLSWMRKKARGPASLMVLPWTLKKT